jgi:hypothetical protein
MTWKGTGRLGDFISVLSSSTDVPLHPTRTSVFQYPLIVALMVWLQGPRSPRVFLRSQSRLRWLRRSLCLTPTFIPDELGCRKANQNEARANSTRVVRFNEPRSGGMTVAPGERAKRV